jgi:hypothetical protein
MALAADSAAVTAQFLQPSGWEAGGTSLSLDLRGTKRDAA